MMIGTFVVLYITGPISHERLQTIRGFLVNITMCVISRGDYRR